jgi:hypothetical protein
MAREQQSHKDMKVEIGGKSQESDNWRGSESEN